MESKDYWESLFDKKYLRWYHLNGEAALVKITDVKPKVQMTLPGGVQARKSVIEYELVDGKIEEQLPLVLNTTNGNSIATLHGPNWKKWVGNEIVLYPTQDRLKGKMTDCIRIRGKKEAGRIK